MSLALAPRFPTIYTIHELKNSSEGELGFILDLHRQSISILVRCLHPFVGWRWPSLPLAKLLAFTVPEPVRSSTMCLVDSYNVLLTGLNIGRSETHTKIATVQHVLAREEVLDRDRARRWDGDEIQTGLLPQVFRVLSAPASTVTTMRAWTREDGPFRVGDIDQILDGATSDSWRYCSIILIGIATSIDTSRTRLVSSKRRVIGAKSDCLAWLRAPFDRRGNNDVEGFCIVRRRERACWT